MVEVHLSHPPIISRGEIQGVKDSPKMGIGKAPSIGARRQSKADLSNKLEENLAAFSLKY